MKNLTPLPITPGQKVIIRLGRKHRQWDRIHDNYKFKWIEGVIDWVSHDRQMMEVRISRKCCVVTRGIFERADFYVRVEYAEVDDFNFRDTVVIRRVAA